MSLPLGLTWFGVDISELHRLHSWSGQFLRRGCTSYLKKSAICIVVQTFMQGITIPFMGIVFHNQKISYLNCEIIFIEYLTCRGSYKDMMFSFFTYSSAEDNVGLGIFLFIRPMADGPPQISMCTLNRRMPWEQLGVIPYKQLDEYIFVSFYFEVDTLHNPLKFNQKRTCRRCKNLSLEVGMDIAYDESIIIWI